MEARRAAWAVGAGLVAVGALLRFATLDLQSFWLDEAFTVQIVRESFLDMVRRVPDTESTPHLYYVLAWAWTQLFGAGEIGLRSLSALCGTATVAVVFWTARERHGAEAAIWAGALVAVNPFLVWLSQEARSYALLVLLSALGVHFFLRAMERARGHTLVPWAVVSAAALLTHYYAAFLVAAQAVFLLRERRDRGTTAAVGAVAAVGIALIPLAVDERKPAYAFRDLSLASRAVRVPKEFLIGFDAWQETSLAVAAAACVAVAFAGLALAFPRRHAHTLLLAGSVAAAGVVTPLVLAALGADYFNSLYVVGAIAPAILVVAAALSRTAVTRAAGAALVVISLVAVVSVATDPALQRTDWRGAAAVVADGSTPRAIVVTPLSSPLTPYLDGLSRPCGGGTGGSLSVTQPIGGPCPAQAEVREIAIVAMAGKRSRGGAFVKPEVEVDEPPGFRIVRRVDEEEYTVVVLRRDGPGRVDPLALSDAVRFSFGKTLVVVQDAR